MWHDKEGMGGEGSNEPPLQILDPPLVLTCSYITRFIKIYYTVTYLKYSQANQGGRGGRFGWKRIQFGKLSVRFTIVASFGAEAIYEMWYALTNVLAKLLTVISLGLAVNAQWCKYESKNNTSLSIFLNFLSWSEELSAVQCEATTRRDHGWIEPRWFLICHTESIHPSNRFEWIIPIPALQWGTGAKCWGPAHPTQYAYYAALCICMCLSSGHSTQWVTSLFGLVFRSVFSLSPKYGLRPKISEKWSRSLCLDSAIAQRFTETKLRTQWSPRPKLIWTYRFTPCWLYM